MLIHYFVDNIKSQILVGDLWYKTGAGVQPKNSSNPVEAGFLQDEIAINWWLKAETSN